MKKTTSKYLITTIILSLTALILLFLVVRNFYSISAFRVNLIYPENRILVSTEFTASIMITGSTDPGLILIKIDDVTIQSEEFENTGYTRVGDFKLLNIKINPESLSEGIHTLEIILKGGMLAKESSVSSEFVFEKVIPPSVKTNADSIKTMEEYFSGEVTDLIIKLNNARYYYTSSDWRQSDGYTSIREKVTEGKININIKEKLIRLITKIEESSPLNDITNAANSLNIELFNSGYPLMTLMFEYRYLNGDTRSLLLVYKIIDSVVFEYNGRRETAYELERLDRILQKEQFLGVNFPNSPFPIVLYDNTKELAEKYEKIFSPSTEESLTGIIKLFGKIIKDRNQIEKTALLIKQELSEAGFKKEDIYKLTRKANAVHEIRHLLDYKTSTRIGKSVPIALDYFYGEITGGSNFSRDTGFTTEKNIATTLMKINPEFSAYLFELAYSEGIRRIQLLNLLEKIINRKKEDTPHHWAAKFILYLLAERNGFADNNLINKSIEGNEKDWLELTMKLIELPLEKLAEESSSLYSYEFDE